MKTKLVFTELAPNVLEWPSPDLNPMGYLWLSLRGSAGKIGEKSMCKACGELSKKTQSCNCCFESVKKQKQ